jgi:hypothetical protein
MEIIRDLGRNDMLVVMKRNEIALLADYISAEALTAKQPDAFNPGSIVNIPFVTSSSSCEEAKRLRLAIEKLERNLDFGKGIIAQTLHKNV